MSGQKLVGSIYLVFGLSLVWGLAWAIVDDGVFPPIGVWPMLLLALCAIFAMAIGGLREKL